MAGAFQCAVCKNPLEDALILMCNHNLCLDCAGRNLKRAGYDPNSGESVALQCSLCQTVTNVDADSATHLVENAPPDYDQPRKSAMAVGTARTGMGYDNMNMGAKSSTAPGSGPIAGIHGVTSMCPSHPDEPLQFFCLDCECKCICAECALHGLHKGHEVLSVKKAYPLLQSKVASLNVELRERVTELNGVAQSWERKQREMLNTQEQMKLKLQEHFGEIRKTLQVKEHEMKRLMGEGLRDGLNFAENKMNEIREQIQQLKDAQGQMQHNTSHSTASMQNAIDALNWYADARLSLNQLLVAELPFPTETSKPNEWLLKYGETAVSKVRDLHLKVQQLN